MLSFNRYIAIIIGCIVAVAVLAAGVAAYGYSLTQPASPSDTALQEVVVPRGASVTRIATLLAEEELIQSPLIFRLVVKQLGIEGELQAGTFELSPAMDSYEIAHSLTEGTRDVWVTLLEGWRMEQMAEYLVAQELALFEQDEFEALAAESEGYLYPETYLIPKASTAEDIHTLLRDTFDERVLTGLADEFDASERTQEEVIIMASLVEREARNYDQMREVAGVLWNRIDRGMPLQVDATLQYVKGYDAQAAQWWSTPLAADKELDSPFNTYQNPGLPPAPIANPSLQAVRATLDPADTSASYYIHDAQGRMHTAETLDGHNANIQEYLR